MLAGFKNQPGSTKDEHNLRELIWKFALQ